ncbi:MAG: hypothetical protein KGL42_07830 [Betaproteobacteria bacterium]|nr:hypothetical protein [Betaproteobacteria bacterium]
MPRHTWRYRREKLSLQVKALALFRGLKADMQWIALQSGLARAGSDAARGASV